MQIFNWGKAAQPEHRIKFKKTHPWHPFFDSPEWLRLRQLAFSKYGRKCMKCGTRDRLQVDHVKPRSIYPKLALDINNLQVLCKCCNLNKGLTEIDYRPSTNLTK